VIIPVILCGGAGTRLWPVSRPDSPKPFLPLFNGQSTFAMTLARVSGRPLFGPIVVVAGVPHLHHVKAALEHAGLEATVLLEPASRDTAAAVAAAAMFVADADAGAMLLVLPADHLVRDHDAFAATVGAAMQAADIGRIVVFGIKPDRPSTAYGYVRPSGEVTGQRAKVVNAFVEKPDRERAAQLIAEGCLWNGGIFLMRAATALAEIRHHALAVAGAARSAVAKGIGGHHALRLADSYLTAPAVSFDYAVMEKTGLAAVVEAGFDWADVGNWQAVWENAAKDAAGNAVAGDAITVDSRGCYVRSARPRIGIVGLDDAIVVASDDAVLVTSRARADRVKDLVGAIDALPEAVIGDYGRHYRPWGYYQALAIGPDHQVKRIVVNPGHRLSLQKHAHRSEHWTVVAGEAEITVGMRVDDLQTRHVEANASIVIPRGAIHRLANDGAVPTTVIEVQVGEYLGEDDIVRLEDDYGRTRLDVEPGKSVV
jgi:mannose-1-phosphate guanylyltransferase/mannose-6-phosphate isomerase